MKLALLSGLVLLINLPFGYWRGHSKRFSLQWFLAVHLPVPLVIALRILGGVGWQMVPYAVLVGAFFVGQFLGGRLHGRQ
jgi:hypothetical protein